MMSPSSWQARWHRAETQRITLDLFNQTFSENLVQLAVIGTKGDTYLITIERDEQTRCSCPDCETNGNFCKHLMLVLIRTLGVPVELVSECGFRTHKVYLAKANEYATSQKGKQKPIDKDDDCPICCEGLLATKEPIVFCKVCGKSVHQDCFARWAKRTCVFCRSRMDCSRTPETVVVVP